MRREQAIFSVYCDISRDGSEKRQPGHHVFVVMQTYLNWRFHYVGKHIIEKEPQETSVFKIQAES